ncbi:8549_t:CDS:2, partial [Racocetra persica]
DETGIEFSVFIEMTPIPDKVNRRERNKYVKWQLKHIKDTFNPTYDINNLVKKSAPYTANRRRNTITLYLIYTTSGAIMWFFGTALGFSKDAEIEKIIFDCVIEYKQLSPGTNIPPDDETDNDQYEYFGNGEVTFKNYK